MGPPKDVNPKRTKVRKMLATGTRRAGVVGKFPCDISDNRIFSYRFRDRFFNYKRALRAHDPTAKLIIMVRSDRSDTLEMAHALLDESGLPRPAKSQ